MLEDANLASYFTLQLVTDVTVTVPSKLNVSEGDGSVQVCMTLVALESTERDFSITIATSDDTGISQRHA